MGNSGLIRPQAIVKGCLEEFVLQNFNNHFWMFLASFLAPYAGDAACKDGLACFLLVLVDLGNVSMLRHASPDWLLSTNNSARSLWITAIQRATMGGGYPGW